jgi:hypothetical protein
MFEAQVGHGERFEEVSNFVGSACKGETDLVFNLVLYFEECSQGLTRSYSPTMSSFMGKFMQHFPF